MRSRRSRLALAVAGALVGAAGVGALLVPSRSRGAEEVRPARFLHSDRCVNCHSTSPRATALRDSAGNDVSPPTTWRGTMMANAFRDPYWRAKVEQETAAAPEHADEIGRLCLRCHGPMVSHEARLSGAEMPTVAAAASEVLAQDGVSCTVCHGIAASGLGTPGTFSGLPVIEPVRRVYGPFEAPFAMPMRHHVGAEVLHGEHVRESALCATCHTLETGDPSAPFLEQSPFLEWRNSEFAGDAGRTCQECHMRDAGTMRIARNPGGRDFPRVRPRDGVREHGFVGGNTWVTPMLGEGAAGTAPAAREMLRTAARVGIASMRRAAGEVSFDVRVENLTGHKLPTGYPARRAWLYVRVTDGDRVVFESGAADARGRIAGVDGAGRQPHRDVITSPSQVVVYETTADDAEGRPTMLLHAMAHVAKDTRLLPRGWSPTGPDAARTAPVGTAGDDDFGPGSDVVTVRVPAPDTAGALEIHAALRYQSVPPAWVDSLRGAAGPAARAFLALADTAPDPTETLAEASARVERE